MISASYRSSRKNYCGLPHNQHMRRMQNHTRFMQGDTSWTTERCVCGFRVYRCVCVCMFVRMLYIAINNTVQAKCLEIQKMYTKILAHHLEQVQLA